MKSINWKKLILPNIPYVFIALFATKLGQAWRLAEGADLSERILHLLDGFSEAFQTAAPSFHPFDLCFGIAAAAGIRLAVSVLSSQNNSSSVLSRALHKARHSLIVGL